MTKGGFVYIMTNKYRNVLYVGVTARLEARTEEHKQHFNKMSFSAKYNVEYLVYYELHSDIRYAIEREKVLKKWRREKKEALINSMNSEWNDLWNEVFG